MALTYRETTGNYTGKGEPLTNFEVDENFYHLESTKIGPDGALGFDNGVDFGTFTIEDSGYQKLSIYNGETDNFELTLSDNSSSLVLGSTNNTSLVLNGIDIISLNVPGGGLYNKALVIGDEQTLLEVPGAIVGETDNYGIQRIQLGDGVNPAEDYVYVSGSLQVRGFPLSSFTTDQLTIGNSTTTTKVPGVFEAKQGINVGTAGIPSASTRIYSGGSNNITIGDINTTLTFNGTLDFGANTSVIEGLSTTDAVLNIYTTAGDQAGCNSGGITLGDPNLEFGPFVKLLYNDNDLAWEATSTGSLGETNFKATDFIVREPNEWSLQDLRNKVFGSNLDEETEWRFTDPHNFDSTSTYKNAITVLDDILGVQSSGPTGSYQTLGDNLKEWVDRIDDGMYYSSPPSTSPDYDNAFAEANDRVSAVVLKLQNELLHLDIGNFHNRGDTLKSTVNDFDELLYFDTAGNNYTANQNVKEVIGDIDTAINTLESTVSTVSSDVTTLQTLNRYTTTNVQAILQVNTWNATPQVGYHYFLGVVSTTNKTITLPDVTQEENQGKITFTREGNSSGILKFISGNAGVKIYGLDSDQDALNVDTDTTVTFFYMDHPSAAGYPTWKVLFNVL